MEQNLVSDEELIKRFSEVLKDSKESGSSKDQFDHSSTDKVQGISEIINQQTNETSFNERTGGSFSDRKVLELENQILASQLEAERKKLRELQSKFRLLENSDNYLEKLNSQLETIKQTTEEENLILNCQRNLNGRGVDAMQKLQQKTVHTAVHGNVTPSGQEDADYGAAISSEPQTEKDKHGSKSKKQDVPSIDLEELKQFEENLAIVKDKDGMNDSETEKVFITKTEKKWFEDIGNLASRIRTPLDDKHQKFYEKDRKRFCNRVIMPETQEVDKAESIPADLMTKAKEAPVNLTSTELDGLRSYLLQLKELIARRETAWARTTERDYNQRVEITRFKNEVSHLRMLCEKRQKDIKERDQLIVTKDEEIKDLQKKIQSLKNAVLKLERRDDRKIENIDGLTSEVLGNSQLVQKSYNVMKRATLLNKGLVGTVRTGATLVRRTSSGKDLITKRIKPSQEKTSRKIKSTSSNSNDEEAKPSRGKSKVRIFQTDRSQRSFNPPARRKNSLERVDEKLQRIEEMLHSDVLRIDKKKSKVGEKKGAFSLLTANEVDPTFQKLSLSNGKMRQEVLTAMAGLGQAGGLSGYVGGSSPQKQTSFYDPKKSQGNAAILANALLAARNNNTLFNV